MFAGEKIRVKLDDRDIRGGDNNDSINGGNGDSGFMAIACNGSNTANQEAGIYLGRTNNRIMTTVDGSANFRDDIVVHGFRHAIRDRLRAVSCPSEIIDQIGFNRRCRFQGSENEKVIAEQSDDADRPGAEGQAKVRDGGLSQCDPLGQGDRKGDGEGDGHHLERWDVAGQGGQDRQRPPKKNGDSANQCGATP